MISGTAPASVSVSASSASICSGSPVTFTATPVNGGTSPSYHWKLNGANVGTNSSTYSSSALANGDKISVVMTSNIACATPNPSTSNIVTITVTQTATPSVTIVSSPQSPQPGNTVTFTASALSGGSAPAYQWFKNGSPISAATASTLTITNAVHADYYSVRLTSNYICSTVPTAMSNYIYIGNVILPLWLEWFRVSKTNSNVSLNWKTAYESNVNAFEIFRSTSPGSTLVKIGSVKAVNLGNGAEYSFKDVPPAKGNYTYQLVQKDRDGTQIILGSRIINWDTQVQQAVADLGSSWWITTSYACEYVLMDMQGRIISKGNIISQISIVKPSARGIYLLRLYSNGSSDIIKLR